MENGSQPREPMNCQRYGMLERTCYYFGFNPGSGNCKECPKWSPVGSIPEQSFFKQEKQCCSGKNCHNNCK